MNTRNFKEIAKLREYTNFYFTSIFCEVMLLEGSLREREKGQGVRQPHTSLTGGNAAKRPPKNISTLRRFSVKSRDLSGASRSIHPVGTDAWLYHCKLDTVT